MNKTTTLVLAAIAGFGLCAQARTTTNELWDVNFSGVTVPEGGVTNLVDVPEASFTDGSWAVQPDDESCVTNGVGLNGSRSNLLELNTQGNDLTWTPTSTGESGNRSIVETDIRFVGADDAPEGFDAGNTAQTAFYLKNLYEDEEPSGYEFFAWAYDMDGGTNKWVSLLTTNDVSFADGWHKLQVVIDYREANPYLHVALDGVEVTNPASPPVAANADTTKTTGRMTAVTFKGTGSIDNFTGTRLLTDFATYDFTAEIYKDGELESTSVDPNREAGDYDDDTFAARFTSIPYHDWDEESVTWALSSVVIVDLSTGAETTYDYTYDKVNHIIASANPCPVLSLDFETFEYDEQIFTNYTGTFSLAPLTYGATSNSVIAKVNYRTLDAYYASATVNVGEASAIYSQFVKPSDAGDTVSWTFPTTTNSTYVLSSVVVANGAAFDSATGIASFTVPEGGIGADKTYVTATYVEGDYSVPESYGWTYDENTGTYTHAVKTFTVTWVSEGATLATYTGVPYGTTTNYVGETPTKASAGGYDYTFAGWSPAVGPVTANTTYTAQFDGTLATIIVISANGATTNGYETLPAAFAAAADGETVALLANVNLDGRVFVNAGATPTYSANGRYATSSDNRSLTLDLNGHCITNSSNIALAGGSLTITNTSDTASVIATTASGLAPVEVRGTGDLASKRTLAVGPNVTLSGPCYGLNVFGSNDTQLNKIDVTVDGTVDGMLFVLGNLKNTANEINVVVNGTVDASNAVGEEKVHTGIAQAGYSTVTVNDGAVVTGESGIETRAGSLVVNGGTITATAPASSYEANGSGMTTKGAAIAVAQHGTALPMSTTLNGGTLSGAESIVVTDVNDNNLGNVEVVATETFAEDATVPEGYSWIEDEVTGDYVLTKVWVVTYANYDGTALQVTTNVTGATTPAYAGATPVKPDDATYTYAFTGWSPAAAATVTADATYTAQFSATEKPQGTILVISANGAVTNLSETLAAAVAAVEDGGKIVLTDDQNAGASRIQVSNKSFTVDLNGQTLSSSEADNIIFRVSGGQTIQIEGTTPGSTFVGSVMIAGSTEGHIAVNGGTYTNDLYCPFYANGTCSAASSIAITNATIVAVDAEAGQPGADSETGFGLYVAGPAATTLKDTTIVADKTGVEIRAGSLVVDGGSITAGDTFSTAANGNGNGGTVYGAAISVSPHNTNKPIAVEVNGGTFTAAKAVYENYLEPQARTAETAVTLNGGSFIGEVDIVEDIGTVIPSTSTALFSDSDAEGVAEGYRLVEDPDHPGLYKVEPIVVAISPASLELYPNCSNYVYVVDAPAGSTYRFAFAGAVGSGGYSPTAGWGKPYGTRPGSGTVTAIVSNNNELVAQLVCNVTVKDVVAVVDGVEYATDDWDDAVAAAITNDKVFEVYYNAATITLSEGQALRWKPADNRGKGTVTCKAPAATETAMYKIVTTTDSATGVKTATCTNQGAPNVMITKADGTVSYSADISFSKNSTNKILRSFSTSRKSVTYEGVGLDLNGCTVTFDTGSTYPALMVGSSAKKGDLTIFDSSVAGDGAIVNTSGIPLWAAYHASTVTVEGGSIVAGSGANAIYTSGGSSAVIKGGTFENTGSATYLVNMKDDERGSITVTGGSFKGFDPMNNTAEGTGTDFVDPAYATLADSPSNGWYTVVPAYTVTWNDEDGTALETDARVATGAMPSYDGETPTKASTAQYDFGFDAWTPAIVAVESNTVYTATYTNALRSYTITWVNYDGTTVLDTDEVAYGETPEYTGETPVKPNDGDTEFEFDGWSPAIVPVEGAATYVAQFSAKENGTVIVITDNGATTNYFATLQAALDDVKENNLQQANIELLADATITISRNGNVLGGNSTTNITINGNDHALHVVRDGTWAQFNTANDATLVLNDVSLTSEFTGTQTGWVGDTLQNPNHNIAFNCDVELNDVTSTTALSFWKDADLDTVTIAETVDVYSIWIHTTASNIAIKDLVVNSPNGRGIKVDDSFVKYAGTPSASTAISIDGASFTTKNRKSAVLVRSAYPIAVTTSGTIDISNVPADTQHLVWVDVDASENFGLVTFNGAQSGLGVEGGASSYAASLTTNAWIAGYYKVLADAVEVATADDTVTLLKNVAETFTVTKALTITRNGFSAENVTAGEGYQRTDTAETYVFAVKPAEEEHIGAKSDDGFVILAPADGDYDTTKPLTFAAPDLTAGTVDISASMIWPDGVNSTTLTLVYKKSLLGPEFTAQVTVAKKGEDSATVTLPDFSGEDTIFFIGFRNKAGVVDKTSEP